MSNAPVIEKRWAGDPSEPVLATAIDEPVQPPVRWRELVAVICTVAIADAVVYRGHGFAGLTLWFSRLRHLLLGAPEPKRSGVLWVLGLMLLAASAKLVWCGSWLTAAAGLALLVAFAAAMAGLCPYVVDVVAFGLQTFTAGCVALVHYGRFGPEVGRPGPRSPLAQCDAAIGRLVAFGALFVMANPDLATSFADYLGRFFRSLWDSIRGLAPTWQEILLWVAVAWFVAGLLPRSCGSRCSSRSRHGAATMPCRQGRRRSRRSTPRFATRS